MLGVSLDHKEDGSPSRELNISAVCYIPVRVDERHKLINAMFGVLIIA